MAKEDLLLELAWRRYDNLISGEVRIENKTNILLVANGILITLVPIIFTTKSLYFNIIPFGLPIVSIILLLNLIIEQMGIIDIDYQKLKNIMDLNDEPQIKIELADKIGFYCDELMKNGNRKLKQIAIVYILFVASISLDIGLIASYMYNV